MKVVSDVLLLSYLHKFGLSLTVEAGKALAVLYSKARLYKGPRLAGLSQSTATRSTGNISVGVKKVGQFFVPFPPKYCCTIVYITNIFMKTKG